MSSHCSGCGSPELALRFLRVAWAAVGFNLTVLAMSSCALGSGSLLHPLPSQLPMLSG